MPSPKTQPARGMRDFLPEDVRKREYVIGVIKEVYERYGFEPLEPPAVENIETLTIADVNLADLTWARAEGTVRNLADRRFDLYRIDWKRGQRGDAAPPEARPMGSKAPGGG